LTSVFGNDLTGHPLAGVLSIGREQRRGDWEGHGNVDRDGTACGVAGLRSARPLGCAAQAESPPPPQVAPVRWAKSSQSTLPQAMQTYVPPGAPGLASQACPFQGVAVPVCQRFDTEAATADKVGRTIRVRGALVAKPMSCTQRNCPSDAPYCNRIMGVLSLSSAAEPLILAEGDDSPWHAKSGFNCVGDASALCCGFSAMGEVVIAEGVLRSFDTREDLTGVTQRLLFLQTTGFCRFGEVTHETTNLSKLDVPAAAVCH
jgi:hypothetical protein